MGELVDVDVPYAIEMKVVTTAQVPVIGTRTTVTRSYSQVRFHEDEAGRWTQTFTACAMENDDPKITFPETFIQSIPARTHDITWTGDRYHVDTGAHFLGVSEPVDVLPRDADDPVVEDADNDGHPGVTVHLTLPILGRVRLYLAQANHSVLDGTLQDGVITGSIELERLETRTLAASFGLLAVNPTVEVVEGASTFTLKPDPGETCTGPFQTQESTQ
jgi:hypothetical protein